MAEVAKGRKKRGAQSRRRPPLTKEQAEAVSDRVPDGLELTFLDSVWSQMDRDQQLDQMLALHFQLQKGNVGSALPALIALEAISARWDLPDENQPPPETVAVPYWVVDTIRVAMILYREALQDTPAKSFGEILGLEGGQGKQSVLKRHEAELREIRLACWIAHTSAVERVTVTAAIEMLESKAGLSANWLWQVWSRHGRRAKSAVGNFLTCVTSRSDSSASRDSES